MCDPRNPPINSHRMLTKVVICATSLRAESGRSLAAAGKQTIAAGGVWRDGERSFTLSGARRLLWKVICFSFKKLNKVSRSKWPRNPLYPSGQQEKGWMNLKQTSERLAVSQTAQQRNELPRAGWTDRRTEWEWLKNADQVIRCAHLLFQLNAIHHDIFRYFYVCVCTHSSKSMLVGLLYARMPYTCLCVWLTWSHKSPANAFPLKPECSPNSTKTWKPTNRKKKRGKSLIFPPFVVKASEVRLCSAFRENPWERWWGGITQYGRYFTSVW